MISITTQRFLIVYSDIILQKNVFFPHVGNFALVVVLFGYLVHGHFEINFAGKLEYVGLHFEKSKYL